LKRDAVNRKNHKSLYLPIFAGQRQYKRKGRLRYGKCRSYEGIGIVIKRSIGGDDQTGV